MECVSGSVCMESGLGYPSCTQLDSLALALSPPGDVSEGDPVPMDIEVSGGEWPHDGLGLACHINGEPETVQVSGGLIIFPAAKLGLNTYCCRLTYQGEPIPGCDALDCVQVKGKTTCDGLDSECADGNPCSVDACVYTKDAYECHYGLDLGNPDCCFSDYDCPCTDDGQVTCDLATFTCTELL